MVILRNAAEEGKKFDYIFGDLTDVPISIDHSTELWAFINQVLDLSFKVLQPNGKFMTHVSPYLYLYKLNSSGDRYEVYDSSSYFCLLFFSQS